MLPGFLDKDKAPADKSKNDLASIRRFAKEGDAESQYLLGHMYATGQKVEHDQAQAVKWYSSAALQGQREAQYRLGLAYIYGIGIGKNTVKGRTWLKKAAEQKVEAATQLLSYLKPDANGVVDYNISLLVSIYLERALNGDSDAQLALGYMLENGWGVQVNAAEAKQWLTKARSLGAKGAAIQLRKMHISESMGAAPAIKQAAPVAVMDDDNEPASGGRFKSLFIPVGLILIGLVLGMLVFRRMDKHRVPAEENSSLF